MDETDTPLPVIFWQCVGQYRHVVEIGQRGLPAPHQLVDIKIASLSATPVQFHRTNKIALPDVLDDCFNRREPRSTGNENKRYVGGLFAGDIECCQTIERR